MIYAVEILTRHARLCVLADATLPYDEDVPADSEHALTVRYHIAPLTLACALCAACSMPSDPPQHDGITESSSGIMPTKDDADTSTLSPTGLPDSPCEGTLHFPDAGLEAAVRSILSNPDDELIIDNLRAVDGLYAKQPVGNLEGIQCLDHLVQVGMIEVDLPDLDALVSLTALRSLTLYGTLHDITSLATIDQLIVLSLRSDRPIDLTPVASSGGPEILNLYECTIDEQGLEPLADASTIRSLDISYTGIANLEPLTRMPALERLTYWGSPATDLSALADIVGLQTLALPVSGIEDLSEIARARSLERLGLRDNEIEDIGPLAAVDGLLGLGLGGNRVTHIDALRDLSLETLTLRDNQISDLSPLENQDGLMILDVANNRVSDLSPLRGLDNLVNLNIAGNPDIDCSSPIIAELADRIRFFNSDCPGSRQVATP